MTATTDHDRGAALIVYRTQLDHGDIKAGTLVTVSRRADRDIVIESEDGCTATLSAACYFIVPGAECEPTWWQGAVSGLAALTGRPEAEARETLRQAAYALQVDAGAAKRNKPFDFLGALERQVYEMASHVAAIMDSMREFQK